jgi:hypothetical protein
MKNYEMVLSLLINIENKLKIEINANCNSIPQKINIAK